jgi:hypothetical protein
MLDPALPGFHPQNREQATQSCNMLGELRPAATASQQALELFWFRSTAPSQRAAAKWNDSRAAIRMPEETVASSCSYRAETSTLQRADELLPSRPRDGAHAATVTR